MEEKQRGRSGPETQADTGFDPVGAEFPILTHNEIHLWLVDLDRPPRPLAELAATLTVDERARAARFRGSELQDRFVAGRGVLRTLLGAYLGRPAPILRFESGQHGKPGLAGVDAVHGLQFNLSHSGQRALYAVAWRDVGVDLECQARRVGYRAVAERICTPREWNEFQGLAEERLQQAFFACWTRKEAIAKALGAGLASGLRQLEVCRPADAGSGGRMELGDATGQLWSVLNLPLDSGWSGALAARGSDWHWRGWDWR